MNCEHYLKVLSGGGQKQRKEGWPEAVIDGKIVAVGDSEGCLKVFLTTNQVGRNVSEPMIDSERNCDNQDDAASSACSQLPDKTSARNGYFKTQIPAAFNACGPQIAVFAACVVTCKREIKSSIVSARMLHYEGGK